MAAKIGKKIKKPNPDYWNEYRVYTSMVDLFNAWAALRSSGSISEDIRIFCDTIQNKLIDIYGREIEKEDGRTSV